MASNQTTNYGLHLWEPEDDFLRSEFNENNETIDTALGELAGRPTFLPLLEQTTSADAAMVSISLAGVTVTDYRQLILEYSQEADAGAYLYLRVNGVTEGYGLCEGSITNLERTYLCSVYRYFGNPFCSARFILSADVMPGGIHGQCDFISLDIDSSRLSADQNRGICPSVSWANLTSLNLVGSDTGKPIMAGAHLKLWGVR